VFPRRDIERAVLRAFQFGVVGLTFLQQLRRDAKQAARFAGISRQNQIDMSSRTRAEGGAA
jgi:hypothetical protein